MPDRIVARLYFIALAAALELADDEIEAILNLAEGKNVGTLPPRRRGVERSNVGTLTNG